MHKNTTIQNAKWIIGCKVFQSLLQLVVGMLSARYLGPSNYGLISYAASVVAFMVPVMQLGMRSTLVQEYVVSPEKEGQILGTSLVLNLVSGVACIVVVTCFAAVSSAGDFITILVCTIYSLQLIFQALEMLQCWFQAKLLSKYSSLAMLGGYIIVSAYKVFLLATRKSVVWFALSHSIEFLVIGVAMIVIYKKLGGQRLSFSWGLAGEMFSRSKYYILASMMVTVFQNTDHVMLKLMVGDAENGLYTAAATCTGISGFVFNAIRDSARPTILKSLQESTEKFEKNIIRLYAVFIYLTVAQGVCFTILAKPIVQILYGEDYLASVHVFRILAWGVPFSYLGVVRNIWILARKKHNILWRINSLGVIVNVIMNAAMIPAWGACGAAFASVLTQIFTNFLLGFLIPSIQENNYLMIKGAAPSQIIEILKLFFIQEGKSHEHIK